MQTKSIWQIIKQTFSEWVDDEVPRLAAALAYYMAFSIAPLILIAISIAGFALGKEAASNRIAQELSTLLGPTAGAAINNLVASASANKSSGIGATIIGIVVLLFGASGVFGELQYAMDRVWDVKPRPGQGVWGVVRQRFFSFTMVLGVAFLLMVSLILSALLSAFGSALLGDGPASVLSQIGNLVVSFAITTLLFALIFKFLPDVKIEWKDVWVGAIVTSILFIIGKELLGWYLGRASTTSAYGAAGSFVALLLWVYYSAQILFLGAEFTQVYARAHGAAPVPADHAISLEDERQKAAMESLIGPVGSAAPTRRLPTLARPARPVKRYPGTTTNASPAWVGAGAAVLFALGAFLGMKRKPPLGV